MKTTNKFKSFLSVALVGGMLLSTTSCKDEFTEINESKTSVVVASPAQLFTQVCWEFQATPYMLWFAQAPKFYYAAQMSVGSGSMVQESLDGGAERQGFQAIALLDYKYALEKELGAMSEEEAAKYKNTQAAIDVLITYLGIFDTDDAGDMPFTEAAQARYGGTLTPKYDRVKDLYDLWLTTLDSAISAFTTSSDQFDLGKQDLVYGGDWSKWAKLANSLKLKIAARLIHQDFARAKSIASAVVSASCGIIDGEADDFFFHKADPAVEDVQGIVVALGYGEGHGLTMQIGLELLHELVAMLHGLHGGERRAGHKGMHTAGEHFFHSGGFVVEHAELSLGEMLGGGSGGRGARTDGDDHVRAVQIFLPGNGGGTFFVQGQVDVGAIVGNGEVHRERTLRRNAHAADDDVKLASEQSWDDAVPIGGHKLAFHAQILGQPFGHVDLEADVLAFLVLHGPGHEGREAHAKRAALYHFFDDWFPCGSLIGGGNADAEGKSQQEGRHDAFHRSSFRSRSLAGMLTMSVSIR